MWRTLLAVLFCVGLSTGAAAQATAPAGGLPGADGAGTAASSVEAAQAKAYAEYKLGSGDKLRIIVFGEESLTGEFFVPGGEGTIEFPLIGAVKAAGLSVRELQDEIEVKLKDGYLKQPHVAIEVLNYRPFYILGEVTKPGEYPFTNGLTVMNAVATANGFTYRADTRRVVIKHANSSGEQEIPLTGQTPVLPGDTIRIKERFF